MKIIVNRSGNGIFSYLPSTLLSSRLVRLRVDMSEKEEVLARAELVLFSLITAWYFFMPRDRELADAGVESFVWQHSHRGVLATTLPSEQIFFDQANIFRQYMINFNTSSKCGCMGQFSRCCD